MKKITHQALVDRFARTVSRPEAEQRVRSSLMRLGLTPRDSYTPDQVIQMSALIVADGLTQAGEGLVAFSPHLKEMLEEQ